MRINATAARHIVGVLLIIIIVMALLVIIDLVVFFWIDVTGAFMVHLSMLDGDPSSKLKANPVCC